jgi:hypothetical protein
MNGQPMLPKWPNDRSSHTVREEPGKHDAKLTGAGIWPGAVPRKMSGRKRVFTEISESRGERWTRTN